MKLYFVLRIEPYCIEQARRLPAVLGICTVASVNVVVLSVVTYIVAIVSFFYGSERIFTSFVCFIFSKLFVLRE